MTDLNEDQLADALMDIGPSAPSSPSPQHAIPMSQRMLSWTETPPPRSPSSPPSPPASKDTTTNHINPQASCLLFSRLPAEIRTRIWRFALTQSILPEVADPSIEGHDLIRENDDPVSANRFLENHLHYRADHNDYPREQQNHALETLLQYDENAPPATWLSLEPDYGQDSGDEGDEIDVYDDVGGNNVGSSARRGMPPFVHSLRRLLRGPGTRRFVHQGNELGLTPGRWKSNKGNKRIPFSGDRHKADPGKGALQPDTPSAPQREVRPRYPVGASTEKRMKWKSWGPGGWARPGYEGIMGTPGLGLLRTCRRAWLEARDGAWMEKEHVFWYYAGRPCERTSRMEDYWMRAVVAGTGTEGAGEGGMDFGELRDKMAWRWYDDLDVDVQRGRAQAEMGGGMKEVRLFTQMFWLEDSWRQVSEVGGRAFEFQYVRATRSQLGKKRLELEDSDAGADPRIPSWEVQTYQRSPCFSPGGFLRNTKTLRITIRRADWWHNEQNATLGINPFRGNADVLSMLRDMGDTLSPERMSLWEGKFNHKVVDYAQGKIEMLAPPPEDGWEDEDGDEDDYQGKGKAPEEGNRKQKKKKRRLGFKDNAWGLGFKNLPALELLVFDMETSEEKRKELGYIVEWVDEAWWFPAAAGDKRKVVDEEGREAMVEQRREFRLVDGTDGDGLVATAGIVDNDVDDGADTETSEKERRIARRMKQKWGIDRKWSWRGYTSHFADVCEGTGCDSGGRGKVCPEGWCERRRRMVELGWGPRLYGWSWAFERVVV